MVLHMGKKHHRTVAFLYTVLTAAPAAFQAQDPHQLINHRSHSVPGRNDHIIGTGIHMLLDQLMGPLIGLGHQGASQGGLRMRIGHIGTELGLKLLFNGLV